MSGPAAIEAREVVRRYGERTALNHLSLTVPAGSVFGVLGPNGSGKSTLLSLLAGGDQPDTGSIAVFGAPLTPASRSLMGVVFQESALDPLATAGENLELSGRLFGLSRGACQERGEALLAEFGLGGGYGDLVTTLSGGMRRRVEVVRALIHEPRLLLLDEPTTGIDAEERAALWQHLGRYVEGGGTVLLATNDLLEADTVCTSAAFLREGSVAGQGTPGELKAGLRRESILVEWDGDLVDASRVLSGVTGVASADIAEGVVQLAVEDASTVAPRLFAAAEGRIAGLRIRQATLEDAYFQYVARSGQAEAVQV